MMSKKSPKEEQRMKIHKPVCKAEMLETGKFTLSNGKVHLSDGKVVEQGKFCLDQENVRICSKETDKK